MNQQKESTSSLFEVQDIQETNTAFREFIRFFRDLVIIFIIVILIRIFIVTPFRINGSSMESSYHDREYILVDKFSYLDLHNTSYDSRSYFWGVLPAWFASGIDFVLRNTMWRLSIHIGDPERGDVVVITPHVDRTREYYIKRVIGLPGDTIYFSEGKVYIKKSWSENFTQLNEPYLSASNSGHTYLPEYVEGDQFLIPEGSYWVMGDNRNNSADSRSCFRNCSGEPVSAHFLKRKDIVGKVLVNFGYFNIFWDGGLLRSGKFTWTYPPRFLDHPRASSYPELGE